MLLSIDPSTTTIGCALFVVHDSLANKTVSETPVHTLYAATSIKLGRAVEGEDPIHRWLQAARAVENWLYALFPRPGALDAVTELVFERMQFYSTVKSKGDPNKLAAVLGVASVLAGRFSMRHAQRQFTYLPAEWTGQISKVCLTCKGKAKKKCKSCEGSAWKTPRGRRIRGRLTAMELAVVPDQNDAIDAVGIGLKHVGRLEIRRVYESE